MNFKNRTSYLTPYKNLPFITIYLDEFKFHAVVCFRFHAVSHIERGRFQARFFYIIFMKNLKNSLKSASFDLNSTAIDVADCMNAGTQVCMESKFVLDNNFVVLIFLL